MLKLKLSLNCEPFNLYPLTVTYCDGFSEHNKQHPSHTLLLITYFLSMFVNPELQVCLRELKNLIRNQDMFTHIHPPTTRSNNRQELHQPVMSTTTEVENLSHLKSSFDSLH